MRADRCMSQTNDPPTVKVSSAASTNTYRLKAQIPARGTDYWGPALTTFLCYGAILTLTAPARRATMTFTVALTCAALTGWIVEWAQRLLRTVGL